MKVYEYTCRECGIVLEAPEGDLDIACPECDMRMKRVFQLAGVSFKGPGFYSFDNKNRGPHWYI